MKFCVAYDQYSDLAENTVKDRRIIFVCIMMDNASASIRMKQLTLGLNTLFRASVWIILWLLLAT